MTKKLIATEEVKADSAGILTDVFRAFKILEKTDLDTKIELLNKIRRELHKYSPFKSEPVDCVEWVKTDKVRANDYNPNSVAPPEMKLLELSILNDGYTQPIVVWNDNGVYEVVDGFHRNRVGRESKKVKERIFSYLPVTVTNPERTEKTDRMASTIRHNRARGKHRVQAMSDIVIELKRRNWSHERISKELGMDSDEVLRLCQINGLAEVFSDKDFSKSWEVAEDEQEITADGLFDEKLKDKKDGGRKYHTWEKWECYKAGFYDERPKDITHEEGEERYTKFLADIPAFEKALDYITDNWKYSCEHYLSNDRMNRIAWLGQASVAQALSIPSSCRGGYHRLTDEQKKIADETALKYLNKWLVKNGQKALTMDEAQSKTEADLY